MTTGRGHAHPCPESYPDPLALIFAIRLHTERRMLRLAGIASAAPKSVPRGPRVINIKSTLSRHACAAARDTHEYATTTVGIPR